ncbi:MAG: carboxypeptidase [Gammaproteobacteria bacterium]
MKIIGVISTVVFAILIQAQVLAEDIAFDPDESVITKHTTRIKGKKVAYTAETGMQPVWDEMGKVAAGLFYTYYKRTDVDDSETRPLVFSFNGGPGSASVWMHIAYTGPRVLNIDSEGYPLQPYGTKSNPHSVLDVADIVFVNPVNTGYSRLVPDEDGKLPSKDQQQKKYFGVNADIKYLAEWMNTFVTRHERWRSPKYLIGESYGTVRVSGLALELQNAQWMYLNGVVLVSPTTIGIDRDGPVRMANRLPYYAATAWYHKVLPEPLQSMEFEALLAEVEQYTIDTYLPALARGNTLSAEQKKAIADKVSYYSGLSVEDVMGSHLQIDLQFFWKRLLNKDGYTVGRLDSRYLGIDRKEVGDRPDYWAELTSWLHSFTPAINHYIRTELGYKTDIKYQMLSRMVHPWDRQNNRTGEQLRQAMAQNPYLHVMTQSGYFDGATNYFDAKYNHWHLDPSGKMKDRMSFTGYMSGHMMYLRAEDLQKSNDDFRAFIKDTMVSPKQAAKYSR